MHASHTPGPWNIRHFGSDLNPASVIAPNGCGDGCPCEVAACVTLEDARLIASAPDLIAALEKIMQVSQGGLAGGFSADEARLAVYCIAAEAYDRATGAAS